MYSHPPQTRLESLVESTINTASGFLVSLLAWQYVVAPLFSLPVSWSMNLWITGIFTAISVARSYLWRRFFNARHYQTIALWLSRQTRRLASKLR